MTQELMILEYMHTHRGITQAEAIEVFGCYRLGARIYDLKQRGIKIDRIMEEGTNRFGAKVRFARYFVGKAA